eukprot:922843_1
MEVANKCLLLLLTHLNNDDRFGLVLFNTSAQVKIPMAKMNDLKMEQMESILEIRASGGTNFEAGYNAGTAMFDRVNTDDYISNVITDDHVNNTAIFDGNQYENRMIFLTDAHTNVGKRSANDLLSLVKDA